MRELLAKYVENSTVAGVVSLVSRGDDVRVETAGDVRRDSIVRISSMTKPMAAAVTMMLVEDGTLGLDERIDRWIPELADRRVLRALGAELDDTEPARRAITVRDLLTMRMGFGFAIGHDGRCPVLEAATELELGIGPPRPAEPPEPDEWIRRFASLPLMHHPGEQWMYELSFAALGVLLHRAGGRALDELMRERLFEPLGMCDTGFHVPENNLRRLPDCLDIDEAADSQWATPPKFPNAANGLVSTVDDCLAFGRMLLDGGRTVLSQTSVEAMTTDQLDPATRAASPSIPVFLGNRGWGLGMSVIGHGDEIVPLPGAFGWDGGLGTSMYCDPGQELVGILMTQRMPPSYELLGEFWAEVGAGDQVRM